MIQKVTTAWAKSSREADLPDSFNNAWSSLLNSLEGSWGYVEYRPLTGVEAQAEVFRSTFFSIFETSLEGNFTLTAPFPVSGPCVVTVRSVGGSGEVTGTTEYIISDGNQSVPIALISGLKVITLQGAARRT